MSETPEPYMTERQAVCIVEGEPRANTAGKPLSLAPGEALGANPGNVSPDPISTPRTEKTGLTETQPQPEPERAGGVRGWGLYRPGTNQTVVLVRAWTEDEAWEQAWALISNHNETEASFRRKWSSSGHTMLPFFGYPPLPDGTDPVEARNARIIELRTEVFRANDDNARLMAEIARLTAKVESLRKVLEKCGGEETGKPQSLPVGTTGDCPVCHGTGVVYDTRGNKESCAYCGGIDKHLGNDTVETCGGEG